MDLDKEITMLQKKVEEQENSLAKLKNQEDKLTQHISSFKQAMKKKTTFNADKEKSPQIDHEKESKQLQKQLQNASIMLKNYEKELKNIEKKSNQIKIDDLEALEETLKDKQNNLKKIKEQIKELQFMKRKQEKVIEKKNRDESGGRLTKLIEEVRKNKEVSENIKQKYQQKEIILQNKKRTLEELEEKYKQKCIQKGEKPLTFEELKEKKKQKQRKRQDASVSRPKNKKVQQSVRELIHTHVPTDLECNQKTLKQLRMKKQLAETSLKMAHKKYEKEIEESEKKLEDLQNQNQNLNTRLMEKKKQKEMAESGYTDNSRSNVSRTMRKLTPLK